MRFPKTFQKKLYLHRFPENIYLPIVMCIDNVNEYRVIQYMEIYIRICLFLYYLHENRYVHIIYYIIIFVRKTYKIGVYYEYLFLLCFINLFSLFLFFRLTKTKKYIQNWNQPLRYTIASFSISYDFFFLYIKLNYCCAVLGYIYILVYYGRISCKKTTRMNRDR